MILTTLSLRFQEIVVEQKLTILNRIAKNYHGKLRSAKSTQADEEKLQSALMRATSDKMIVRKKSPKLPRQFHKIQIE